MDTTTTVRPPRDPLAASRKAMQRTKGNAKDFNAKKDKALVSGSAVEPSDKAVIPATIFARVAASRHPEEPAEVSFEVPVRFRKGVVLTALGMIILLSLFDLAQGMADAADKMVAPVIVTVIKMATIGMSVAANSFAFYNPGMAGDRCRGRRHHHPTVHRRSDIRNRTCRPSRGRQGMSDNTAADAGGQ